MKLIFLIGGCSFILFIIVVYILYIYYRKIYIRNCSKKYFDLNTECNINFEEKYYNLALMHNKLARQYKKTYFIIPLIPFSFFGLVILTAIKGIYGLIFFITLILLILIFVLMDNKNKKNDKVIDSNLKIHDMKKKYYNLILNKIIIPRFSATKKYIDIKKDFLRELFQNTNKKIAKDFDCEFCLECYINNKKVNIYRINNFDDMYLDPNDMMVMRRKKIYYFIGYLIKIPNFSNLQKLNKLDKNDYILDKEKNILYILLSDQIKSNCYSFQGLDRFVPKLYLKFEKEKFLRKNYIFFDQLYNFISDFLL